ncbi:LamG-like jellyroll fold domain-containing protein [Streptomyces sp. NPDC059568]|uniref:LamG domain-containing protein n=1 Tax=Streptomyces sp. NPDC059568 TaxID=3346868 RepID=UPI00369F02D2
MRRRGRRFTTGSLVVAAVLGAQGTAVAAVAAENLPPRQPVLADLLTDSKPCGAGELRTYVSGAPVLSAVLYDPVEDDRPAEGNRVKGQFEVWWRGADGAEQRLTYVSNARSSGDVTRWQLPSDIPADTVVSWRVGADDGTAVSPWSSDAGGSVCEFVRDAVSPQRPVVRSAEYPDDDTWSDGVGNYGTFTVDSPSDDVVEYRYSFTGGPLRTAKAETMGGPVAIRFLPPSEGVYVLEVSAVDRSGRVGPPTDYVFRVGDGRIPVARWKLADAVGSGTAVAETGPAAPAGAGVTFGEAAPDGTALTSTARLDGTDDGFLTPGTPVVDTTKTFAVGGWVRPERLDGDMTVVSQDAGTAPGFTLGARTEDGSSEDGPSDDGESAWSFAYGGARVSGGTPQAGEWAYVLGQYDAETGMTRLYVNGQEVGEQQRATAVESAGDLQIGRARDAAGYGDRWQGEIGDIRAYDRVVVPEEVARLAHRTPRLRGHWSLESAQDGASPELYGGAPLKLGAGATIHRGPDGSCLPELDPDCPAAEYALVGDGHLVLDGDTGFAATDAPVVDTDDSFTIGVVLKLADSEPERPMTVLSQGGENGDAFKVRYVPSTYTWELVMSHADEHGSTETVVGQQAGWPDDTVRLAVVYDNATDQIRLYVNGSVNADATATFRHPWKSTGGLQVGRAHTADGWGEYLRGAVDEVHAFSGVLSGTELNQLGFGGEPCLC